MGLKLLVPPDRPPVTLAEVKAQLNIQDDDEDAMLEQLIEAATASLDGPQGDLCGRALMPQTWEWTVDAFPANGGWLDIPLPPLIEVQSVTYRSIGDSPSDIALDAAEYVVDDMGEFFHARISPVASVWPTTDTYPGALRIVFTAGYLPEGESPAESPAEASAITVPMPIRQAIIIMVRDWYGQGSAFVDRAQTPNMGAYEHLIRQWVLRIV